jgi:hypothetical protein
LLVDVLLVNAAQTMKLSRLTVLILAALAFNFFSGSAHAQDPYPSGTALILGCKSGKSVPGYKEPGFGMRAYAHFTCGSSVYVWNATPRTALVQQGTMVAYIASRYVLDAGVSEASSPVAVRTFLQGIAEGLELRDASAISTRGQLVRSCLASHGCQVEAWSNLAWTRINRLSELADSPELTLRLWAGGIYYSAFVVNPPVRFKDRPLPSLRSPVLVVDGGGLSLAIVDHSCYTLGANGNWAAAGVSAVQSVAAIQ